VKGCSVLETNQEKLRLSVYLSVCLSVRPVIQSRT